MPSDYTDCQNVIMITIMAFTVVTCDTLVVETCPRVLDNVNSMDFVEFGKKHVFVLVSPFQNVVAKGPNCH